MREDEKKFELKEFLNFHKFSKLSDEDKMIALVNYWQYPSNVFYGRIPKYKDSDKTYIFIDNIRNIDNSYIENPFNGNKHLSLFCLLKSISKDVKLEENDIVMFTVEISNNNDERRYIKVNEESLVRLNRMDNLKDYVFETVLEDYFFDEKVVKELNNKFIERNKLYKIYVHDDFKIMAQETLKEIEAKKCEIERNISLLKKYQEKEENKLTELKEKSKEEKEKIKIAIRKLSNDYENIEVSMGNLLNIRNEYIDLGLIEDDNNKNLKRNKTKKGNINKVEHIHNYLRRRDNKPLIYKREIIEQFFIGLNTKQLIILGGAPGSGKTSLVEGFAEAIGANCKMISVRPNWNGVEDLLGYYNPMEKCYVSTPMIDAIIEANNNPEELYIICLDEMNIACVEEYFSEILSALYAEKRSFNLYSKDIYSSEMKVFERLLSNPKKSEEEIIKDIGIKEYSDIERRCKNLNKYTPVVKIPSNVRFVGTINRDSTTKDLSPKVIDRSIIININSSFYTFHELLEKKEEKSIKPIFVGADELTVKSGDIKKAFKVFGSIIELFNKNNIELNFRFLTSAATMISMEEFNMDNLIDYVIATKILPKLNNELNENGEELIDRLRQLVSQRNISKEIYENMISFYEEHRILTYWR